MSSHSANVGVVLKARERQLGVVYRWWPKQTGNQGVGGPKAYPAPQYRPGGKLH